MSKKIFQQHGLTEEALKAYWTAQGENPKRKQLQQLICDRVKEGIEAGLRDHKIYWAIDLAYDAPFNQLAPTIVKDILSRHRDTNDILDALKRWNVDMDDIIYNTVLPDGKKAEVLNVPAFFQVIIPLVKAYVTIRRAKLFNDRNNYPFFKYEPAKNTTLNKLIGEIVTDIVDRMTTQYGYRTLFKQILLQMLQYGTCLQFPMEEWHQDQQFMEREGKVVEGNAKEGLRYWLPHPSRSFIDHNHRPSTFNTDTGCEFGGYWKVNRFSEVADNPHYWNKDNISYGSRDWLTDYKRYFSEVSPCSLVWPTVAGGATTGAGKDDRENTVATYSTNDRDKAIFTVELFMKLVPKDWGMGTYPYKTWMRFVVGGADTVMWNAPLPYSPIIYWGYDPDESRRRNSSLSLEILPFQDHFSNFMSQFIFSVKQNLSRFVWYDTAQVGSDVVQQVENLGKRRYASVPFVPYNSRQARMAGTDPEKAFTNVTFPLHNVQEIMQAMTTTLSILERVMVLSSQEIGQQASHEQTAEEQKNISANTLTRVNFTGSGVDDGQDAWKNQLFRACRANLDDDVSAQVSLNVPGAKEALEKLGFEVKDTDGEATPKDVLAKVEVLGKMSNLELASFISTREGQDRTTSMSAANAMAQVLAPILGNEHLFYAIGEEQVVELINQMATLAGMPRDFKLMVKEGGQAANRLQAMQQEFQKMVKQIQESTVDAAMQKAGEEIAKPLVQQIVDTDKAVKETQAMQVETVQEIRELTAGLTALAARIKNIEQLAMQHAAPAPPPIQPPMLGPGVAPPMMGHAPLTP